MPAPLLPPVVRTLALSVSAARAFAAFTTSIGCWWPRGLSASGEELADVVVECVPGGRMYEVDRGGRKHDWAAVRDCRCPTLLVLRWGLGLDGEQRTEVELRFSDQQAGSRLLLEHRGFQVGEEAARGKFDAPGGWDVILEAFRRHLGRAG